MRHAPFGGHKGYAIMMVVEYLGLALDMVRHQEVPL
jgi:LDH2 family malate/lactate/ureidoglycolate dehydrogenase